jgi:glycosyltransferase involved in cell wall biosynthesis
MVGAIAAIHKWKGTWRKKIDVILTPAKFMKDRLVNSSLNVAAEKVLVKRNFIDDPGFSPAKTRASFCLFVGRLSEEKGVQTVLKAWSAFPNERLVIAGDGPDREKILSEYGNLPNVQFIGKKSHAEIIQLMKQCRVLLFPSIWYEGLPLTIIEALATGTPIIATRLGAMQEMITDNHNGLLYDAGNVQDFSDVFRRFITMTGNEADSMYDNARETYLQTYHPEKCYTDIMNVYNRLLSIDNQD